MKPMPAGARRLAQSLVDRVRHYERNCRCPQCHGAESGPLACIECEFCVANLRKLLLGELTTKAAGAFFSCLAETDRANLLSMKTVKAIRKPKLKAHAKVKAKAKLKAKAKTKATPRAHAHKLKKPAASARPKSTLSVISGGPRSGDSDRGFYLRFGTEKDGLGPSLKAAVKATSEKAGVSMNEFAAAATLYWVEMGEKGEFPPSIVAEKKAIAV
jgi:hypothetical protein